MNCNCIKTFVTDLLYLNINLTPPPTFKQRTTGQNPIGGFATKIHYKNISSTYKIEILKLGLNNPVPNIFFKNVQRENQAYKTPLLDNKGRMLHNSVYVQYIEWYNNGQKLGHHVLPDKTWLHNI